MRYCKKKLNWKKRERQCKSRKNIQKICVSKKDSKSFKNKSAAEKRKSENEIYTIVKKKTSRRENSSQKEEK